MGTLLQLRWFLVSATAEEKEVATGRSRNSSSVQRSRQTEILRLTWLLDSAGAFPLWQQGPFLPETLLLAGKLGGRGGINAIRPGTLLFL